MVSPISLGSIQHCEICHGLVGTKINCAHFFCTKCLSEFMQAKLKQGVVTLKCPIDGCEELLEPTICKTIVWSTVYNKWSLAPGSKNFEAEPPASTDQSNPCGICRKKKGTSISCSHVFCKECLSQYVQTELQSGVAVLSLKCPENGCDELLEPNDCKANVRLSVYSQWRIAVRRYRNGLQTTNQEYQQFSKVAPVSDLFYCNICMKNVPNSNGFTVNPCSHTFCIECVTQHLLIKITESVTNIRCPDPTCKEGVFEPDLCRKILKPEIFDRWCALRSTESAIGSNGFKCPYENCSALIKEEADHRGGKSTMKKRCVFLGIPCRCAVKKNEIPEATMSKCAHCNRRFCVHCRVPWHDGLSCNEYAANKEREDFLKLQILACSRSSFPVTVN